MQMEVRFSEALRKDVVFPGAGYAASVEPLQGGPYFAAGEKWMEQRGVVFADTYISVLLGTDSNILIQEFDGL